VLLPWLLLAAPVVAGILFWGTWAAVVVCAVVALAQVQSFRQTERFSSRVWRAVGRGTKGRQARAAEVVYLLTAAAGVGLLVVALLVG
jgi:hypothetical protein